MNTLVNITMHVSFIRTGHQLLTETFPSVPRCIPSEMNNYPLPNRKTEIRSGKPRNIKIATLNYLILLMPAVTLNIAVFYEVTLCSTDCLALIHAAYLGFFYLCSDPFTPYYSNRQVPTFPCNSSLPIS